MKKRRTRNYATIVYPESAPEDWMKILEEMHIPAIISPLHDKDETDEGTLKKEHYHVVLLFDNVKTFAQASEVFSKIGGVGCEAIHSVKGYARYICHLDNKDKHQYNPEEVKTLSGANYETLIQVPETKYQIIADILKYCNEYNVTSFSEVIEYAMESNFEWFKVICDNGAIIKEYLKSKSWWKKS